MARCPQSIYEVLDHQKTDLLLHLLAQEEPFHGSLIFVRSRDQLHELTKKARALGLTADSISGNKKPELREKALPDLKNGAIQILFATEAVLRGVDLNNVRKVIHFDLHELDQDYLAQLEFDLEEMITFVTQSDRKRLPHFEELGGPDLERKKAATFNYDPYSKQIKAPAKKGHVPNKTESKPLQKKKPKLKNKGPRRKTGRSRQDK